MERYIIFFLLFTFTNPLLATTAILPEKTGIDVFTKTVGLYKKYVRDEPITNWNQIHEIYPNLSGINSYFDDDISKIYAFVPLDDRPKFQIGNIILVRTEPLDYPSIWKDRSENEKENDQREPIRFVVLMNDEGKAQVAQLNESEFQGIFKEAGVDIPSPTPFMLKEPESPNSNAPTETDVTGISPSAQSELTDIGTDEVNTEENPVQSSQWWLWLMGTIIVLGGLAWLLGRKTTRS